MSESIVPSSTDTAQDEASDQGKKSGAKSRSRSWMLTLPVEHYDEEYVREHLGDYDGVIGQMEKGEDTGYLHWQLLIEHGNAINFSALRKKFPKGHFEQRHGTRAQAVKYVTKEDTRVGEPFMLGVVQMEDQQGKRTDLDEIRSLVLDEELSADEILLSHPTAWRYAHMIENLCKVRDKKKFRSIKRDVLVTYIHGKTAVGKTTYVYDKHGFEDVYTVTDYKNPFDEYDGESVLLLDEFRSSLNFGLMLKVLDGFPLTLPARFANKVAQFTTVYVVSNLRFKDQYPTTRQEDNRSWQAFARRFNGGVMELHREGEKRVLRPEGEGMLDFEIPESA